ncbi:MAG TPA: type II toxin-antitoxin system RelE/ParE family toxin [Opitutaceae bacterium]
MAVRYFPAARDDIRNALKWSAENFGEAACQRYKELIGAAIAAIAANPGLPHSYEVRGLQPGIRLYHLKHSRKQAAVEGQIVRKPRHFIAYMVMKGDTVIVGVLHERMEIARQPEEDL